MSCLAGFGVLRLYGLGGAAAQALPGEQGDKITKAAVPAAAIGKDKPLPVVAVETVKTGALTKTMSLTGSVTPTRTARMASPGEGPVEACAVREGDRAKKGQTLVRIGRHKAVEAQLAAARQALVEQEMELKRVEQLVQGGAIPGAQLDTARSKYENARAQLMKTMESNEDYSVKAPWDGVVSKVHVTEGDYVTPRAALVDILDPASLVVQFAVPEAQSTDVRDGMPVRVRFDAHPGETFPGEITRVYPQLDDRMRTRTVEANLTGRADLLPGMFARIQVILAQIPDAVTIAAEAVRVTPKGEKILFVVRDGKATVRKVQTGIEDAGRVQIVSGVQAGDQVVIAGSEKLKDGVEVQVVGGDRS